MCITVYYVILQVQAENIKKGTLGLLALRISIELAVTFYYFINHVTAFNNLRRFDHSCFSRLLKNKQQIETTLQTFLEQFTHFSPCD